MATCFGVLEMWSSPRITCVIPTLSRGPLTLGCESLRRAETGIGFAFTQQTLCVLAVDSEPFGLTVGAVPSNVGCRPIWIRVRAFIPVEAEPPQVLDQLAFI